jgi:hypothetical protein
MNNQRIYWTSIEYTYTPQSSRSGKVAGGFVYGFVKASDEREALNKFIEQLKHQGIDVKEVEFISWYDINTKWETEEQTNNFMAFIRRLNLLMKFCSTPFMLMKQRSDCHIS